MTRLAEKPSCDTFIIYRGDFGNMWARRVYDWMLERRDCDFGGVYYSEMIPTANYVNDIAGVVRSAKNIIILLTNGFTVNFPKTREEYELCAAHEWTRGEETLEVSGKTKPFRCVTALEIYAVMDRMREDSPLKLFVIGGELCAEDTANLSRLASGFGTLTEAESDARLGCITTHAVTSINLRTAVQLEWKKLFDGYLTEAALSVRPFRYRAVNDVKIDDPGEIIAQRFYAEGNNRTDNGRTLEELAGELFSDKQSRFAVIVGDGGMGKTTQLQKFCLKARYKYNKNPENALAAIYFSLNLMNLGEFKNNRLPFSDALASGMGFTPEDFNGLDTKDFCIKKLFGDESQPYLLCLDGVDEIESDALRLDLYFYAETIVKSCSGVRILFTTRSAEQKLLPENIRKYSRVYNIGSLTDGDIEQKLGALAPGNALVPQRGSPLRRLLYNPFNFMTYYNTVKGCGDLSEVFNNTQSLYFYHSSPESYGELFWNFFMRSVAKRTDKNNVRMSEFSSRLAYYYFVVTPRLTREFTVRNIVFTSTEFNEKVERVIGETGADYRARWRPFWQADNFRPYFETPPPEEPTPWDYFKKSELFEEKNVRGGKAAEVYYGFRHDTMREFFIALDVVGQLDEVARGNVDPELPVRKGAIAPHTAVIAGMICGERGFLPKYNSENQRWESRAGEGIYSLPVRTLNAIRGCEDSARLTACVYAIMKSARAGETGLPDLSGVDFSGADMRLCSLNNVIFSHHAPGGSLLADFRKARFDGLMSFSDGHPYPGRKIVSLAEPSPSALVSVDEGGVMILWDVEYALPLSKLYLTRGGVREITRHHVSDIYVVSPNELTLALDDELLTVTVGERSLSVSTRAPLASGLAVRVGKDSRGLYYHTADRPLDRRRMDGSRDGEPAEFSVADAVVNREGDTAYALSWAASDDNFSFSVGGLYRYRRENGRWGDKKTVLDARQLKKLVPGKITGWRLYLDSDILYAVLNLKYSQDAVVELELRTETVKRRSYPLDRGNEKISAMLASRSGTLYYAWRNSIVAISHVFTKRYLRGGTANLGSVHFNPSTDAFFTVTKINPIIQKFQYDGRGQCRCVAQIVPKGAMYANAVSPGFQYGWDMEFSREQCSFSKYPDAFRLIIAENANRIFEVDVSTGITDAMDKNTVISPMPVVAINGDIGERYRLEMTDRTVKLMRIDTEAQLACAVVNAQWLFAGCDFTGASFDGEPPASLSCYAVGIGIVKETASSAEPDYDEDAVLVSDDEDDDF